MNNILATFVKILVALAIIAALIVVFMAYGDKIIAWLKKMKDRLFGRKGHGIDLVGDE
jgi:predicted PurR-regulated permease PerM